MNVAFTIPMELRRGRDDDDPQTPMELRRGRPARTHAAINLAWDETQETLSLGLNRDLTLTQEECAWQVMISTSTLAAFVVPYDGAMPIDGDAIMAVRPPIALTHTGADAMWHGLYCTPSARTFEQRCEHIDEHADVVTYCYCRDGAASNSKLTAHTSRTVNRRKLTSDKVCELHSLKLSQTAVSQLGGKELLGMLFSMALLFRSATQYFLRLVYSLENYVQERLVIRPGLPPLGAAEYACIICSFMSDSPDTQNVHSQTSAKRMAWWHELTLWLNGCWWLDSGRLVHYTTCMLTPEYRAMVVQRIVRALRNTLFFRKPRVPTSNKWTQLFDCVSWVVLSVAPHDLMTHLYPFALADIQTKITSEAASFHQRQGHYTHEQELNWHAVQGKRMLEGKLMFENKLVMATLCIMHVALEVLHFYAAWLIKHGASAHDARRAPVLFDLTNLVWSPIIVMRQYFAGCLRGFGSRVTLICRRAGFSSVREWIASDQTQARKLQQTLLTADAWVYCRHELEFMSWPWLVACTADVRIALAERIVIATRWLAEPCRWCLDAFFCRRFREMFPDVTAVMFCNDRFYMNVVVEWARSVLVHIAGIENRHARNRRGAACGQTWANFVTRYINREACTIRNLRMQMWETVDRGDDSGPIPAIANSDGHEGAFMRKIGAVLRAHTPFEVFEKHESVCRQISADRIKPNYNTTRAALKLKWAATNDSDADKFTRIAAMTKPVSKDNRKRKKAKKLSATTADEPSTSTVSRRHPNVMLNLLNEWIARPTAELPKFGGSAAFPVQSQQTDRKPFCAPSLYQTIIDNTDGGAEAATSNYKCYTSILGTGAGLPAGKEFPARVEYPKTCSAVCNTREPQLAHDFARRFLADMDIFRKSVGKPVDIPSHNIVIVFESSAVCGDGGFSAASFATLSVCSGGAFGMSPTFTFHTLTPVGDWEVGRYEGMLLQLTYHDKIETMCEVPDFMPSAMRGRLVARTAPEQTLLLLNTVKLLDESIVRRVRATRLHTNIEPADTLDLYRVSSVCCQMFDISFDNLSRPPDKGGTAPAAATDDSCVNRAVFGDTSDEDMPHLPPTAPVPALTDDPACPVVDPEGPLHLSDVALLGMLGLDPTDVAGPMLEEEALNPDDVDDRDGCVEGVVGETEPSESEHPSDAIVSPSPFPPGPHRLATVLTWCRAPTRFSTPEILAGLGYLGYRAEGWTVFFGAQRIGRMHCNNGIVLHATCCHAPAQQASSSTRKGCAKSCACSLQMRVQDLPELRRTEADLLLWLIAGSVMSVHEHLELADELHAERRATRLRIVRKTTKKTYDLIR